MSVYLVRLHAKASVHATYGFSRRIPRIPSGCLTFCGKSITRAHHLVEDPRHPGPECLPCRRWWQWRLSGQQR